MLRVKERGNIFIHVHIDWKEPKNLLFPCFVHLQQWEDGKRNHFTTHKAQNIAIKYWKWKSIWRELLLYGTHSQLHSMQSSCRVVRSRTFMTETSCFVHHGWWAPFCCLEWAKTYPARVAIWGAESKWVVWGLHFVLGQKARGGCSLWEQAAREVKPSAGPNMV